MANSHFRPRPGIRTSPKSPLSDAFAARWNGQTADGASPRERAFAWNPTQHGHWLGWLAGYDRDAHGSKEATRSAEFVYNHILNPQMLIWLAEAVGGSRVPIRECVSEDREGGCRRYEIVRYENRGPAFMTTLRGVAMRYRDHTGAAHEEFVRY